MSNELDLAHAALRHYGLSAAGLSRLGGTDNINFKVKHSNEIYVLRLRKAERHTRASVKSELQWLSDLKEHTQLSLAEPIKNIQGDFVTLLELEGKTIFCTLMTWIEGNIPPTIDYMTEQQLYKVGVLMAILHKHSSSFGLANEGERPSYDEAYFKGQLTSLTTALASSRLAESALLEFKQSSEQVMKLVSNLAKSQEVYGLIHADFHSGNYLIHEQDVRIIDFDRCGFGFYLHDLALALMELEEQRRPFILQGYSSVKPLAEDFETWQSLFLALAYIDNLGFLAQNPEELDFIVADIPLVQTALNQTLKANKTP